MDSRTRILVVDDEHSLVRTMEGVLKKEGYEVLTAFDGLEGLQKAQVEKPDLIILDIIMPKMDGYEVCRRLQNKRDTATIPVILLTVKGQMDAPNIDAQTLDERIQERMAGFNAGALDFLSKPVAAKKLLERVRDLL